MTDIDFPPITLPAELVIPAWRSAAVASLNHAGPSLDRTIHIERHATGLRFAATDTFVLVASWAGEDRHAIQHVAPDHDEAPSHTLTAIAADRLMTDFLKHRAAEVKAFNRAEDPGPGPIDITFSLGTIDEPDAAQQRLDIGGDDNRRLIVSCDTERIALPLFDGDYPNWRGILASYKPATRAKVSVRRDILHRIGQLDSHPSGDDDNWLTLTMANGGDLVMVAAAGRAPIEGAFAPRRDVADAEADQAA